MRQIQVQPGELCLTREPTEISTLLGSCVAFTMRHAQTGLGALCHCVLAARSANKPPIPGESRWAYLDWTVHEMVGFFCRYGVPASKIEVKLFGGSDVLKMLSGPNSVGRQNIEAAHTLVTQHGLNLLVADTGGPAGRKICFRTDTGRVKVFHLRSTDEQNHFNNQLLKATASGNRTLAVA